MCSGLSGYKSMRKLDLSDCEISSLAPIGKMFHETNIEELDLKRNKFGNQGFEYLCSESEGCESCMVK